MGFSSWWNNEPEYGPTYEELGYTPPAQPGFFENIWNDFAQSPHLQSAGSYFNQALTQDQEDPNSAWEAIKNLGVGGFRGMQEIGKAGGEALGILPVIEASEDIISMPYRGLGMLADVARSGGLEGSNIRLDPNKPDSFYNQVLGTDVQAPLPVDVSIEGLKALGAGLTHPEEISFSSSFPFVAPSNELSQIALGRAERGDVDPIVEAGIRQAAGPYAIAEDIIDPLARVGLQIPLDPVGAGMGYFASGPRLARALGAINLPSDVMDVVDTSGNYLDVGEKYGYDSPESTRALSTFLGTAALTGADIAPQVLGTSLEGGGNIPPETTLGSEAGVLNIGPINPFQEVQASSQAALEQKISALKDLGYSEEVIGNLNVEDVNNILSANTPASRFISDPIERMMRDYGISREFAEDMFTRETLGLEGPVPEPPVIGNTPEELAIQETLFGTPKTDAPYELGNTEEDYLRILEESGLVPPEPFIGRTDEDVARILGGEQYPGEEPNIVYHGTPYDFEQFDLSRIGTGEGAQAYGHGFYFAENPDVARGYAENLGIARSYSITAGSYLDAMQGDTTKAVELIKSDLEKAKVEKLKLDSDPIYRDINKDKALDIDETIDDLEGAIDFITKERKSQVLASQIPSPEEFLDLDVPLGEQSEKVKAAIPDVIQKAERYEPNLIKAVHDVEAGLEYAKGQVANLNPFRQGPATQAIRNLEEQLKTYNETGDIEIVRDIHDELRILSKEIPSIELLRNNLMQSMRSPKLSDKQTMDVAGWQGSNLANTSELSQKLSQQGLKGVKYFDRQSRMGGQYDDSTSEGQAANLLSISNNINEAIADTKEAIKTYTNNLNNPQFNETEREQILESIREQKAILNSLTTGSYKNVLKEGTRNYVVFDPKDIKILAKTKDISKENLARFVADVKEKYGKNWRKELTPKEKTKFNDLQLAVQKYKLPESMQKYSPALKEAYEKGQLPEHLYEYAEENLPKQEEVNKAREEMKQQVKALGPAPVPIQNIPTQQNVQPPVSIPVQAQTSTIPPTKQTGQVPPTAPPNKGALPPGKQPPKKSTPPPKPSQQLKPISALRSATRSTIENLKYTNAEIGRRVEAYDESHAKNTSRDIYKVREATQGLDKKSEERVVNFLDGQNVILNPKERVAATKLRTLLDDIANRADAEGVLVGYRQGYFPRKYKDRWEWQISPIAFKAKGMHGGHLQTSRKANKMNFRRDFKVLEEYANEAERRISEARFLGKSHELVTGKQFVGDRDTVKYLETAIRRVTGQEGTTRISRAGDVLRRIVALGDLTRAAIFQPAQITHTASQVGLRRAAKAFGSMLSDFKGEQLNAIRSGAVWPNINHEVSKALGDKGYMHGIPTMDKIMRVHANIAGRILYQDAVNGSKAALKQLASLGLNTRSGADAVGKAIADKTQFRTGTLDMPLWTHSPMGKMVTQYSSFMYAHAKFMRDLLKNPVDNFGKIARFGGLGLLAGEGVGTARAILDSLIPGDDEDDELIKRALEAASGDEKFDDKEWTEKLQFVLRNKRVPLDSPAWRALQNFSMIGGVGIFQSMFEKATSKEDFLKSAAGPAISQSFDLAEAIRKDVGNKEFREVPKFGIQNLPTPFVSPYKLASKVYPPRSRKTSFGSFNSSGF